ncbi:hypothetical protein GTZ99_05030 [Novosphingobium sp. FSY-8]|uniref:Disulfide bond formation protein DsbB n=1 Tax=Novosphingobium ovatum TaxID=1908523 RepID=A0ABW9XBJ4_9SPHN|nr:hypothetical protein [Novosphingobium ovatum]NBC35916.1 hypothetical protein [Novosphingobium ovatum]
MAMLISCLLALFSAAVPYALALVLAQACPQWGRDRTRWVAAAPLSLLALAVSGALLLDAFTTPLDVCGPDCRDYALLLGGGGLVLAVLLGLLGLAAAGAALKKR